MLHPLIDPQSPHYEAREKSAIELMEEEFTIAELIAWCKGNIFKYKYRNGHKFGTNDNAKIKHYKEYKKFLEMFKNKNMVAKKAYKENDIQIKYRAKN
jgi:hypothetical protein